MGCGDKINKNEINLPSDIKVGTKISVRNSDNQVWLNGKYIGQYEGLVFVQDKENKFCANGYLQAKIPDTDWSEVPFDSKVLCWDTGRKEDAVTSYFVAIIEGVPFFSRIPRKEFLISHAFGINVSLHSWKHVELIEE